MYTVISGDGYMGFNNAVFLSERETADRNYSMAYYLKENRCFPPKTNLANIMDLYFQVAGNALARVQRVHEPVDLWDTTYSTCLF